VEQQSSLNTHDLAKGITEGSCEEHLRRLSELELRLDFTQGSLLKLLDSVDQLLSSLLRCKAG